jgi:hypothetical protein
MKLTKEQAINNALEALQSKCWSGDIEKDHVNADNALVALLLELGCSGVIEEYNKVEKWYA